MKCFIFCFVWFVFPNLSSAQDDPLSCPCENCPGIIEDDLTFREYQLNIFNIQNNNLLNPDQCVSKVGITFKHEYVGDLLIKLESPDGIEVDLIGQVTSSAGERGQTDNRIFDISFVPNSTPAQPDLGYETRWDNDQEWTGIGVLDGSYHVYRGDLADFNSGRVNGTWTLKVGDFNDENNDEGELLDFYVEFCDPEGLVCDPCLDPEDSPTCVFGIDAGEATVVPGETFCLPIYAENVAFVDRLQFPLQWDPTILDFIKVDSFKTEFLDESQFDTQEAGNGILTLNYNHTDNLGLVVADSTPIFSVCFQTIGGVGDSSLVTIPNGPTAINVDNETLVSTSLDGTVKVAVDSTADCIRAIQLCGGEPIAIAKSRGPGFEENEACTLDGQEFQSKWFRFDVLEGGQLEFVIRPKGDASYGYSLFKGACPNEVISELTGCESGFPLVAGRVVGVSSNPLGNFGISIDILSSFAPSINAALGETYYLLVDNFSDNGVGFDLEFAGTAKIGDKRIQAKILDPQVIDCRNETIRLDATASSQGLQYSAAWSTDTGSINTTVGLYQPMIVKGGKFTLTISDQLSGCVVKDSVQVLTDVEFPTVVANNGGTINCGRPILELNSNGSSVGVPFVLEWQNLTNLLPNAVTTPNFSVDEGGNYQLKITNIENGCVGNDTVLVEEDFVDPPLTANDGFIACNKSIVTLSAESSAQVGFEWTGNGLDGVVGSPQVSVADTGNYFIKITAINGCTTTDTVRVRDERIYPNANAGATSTLNCDNPTLNLDGSQSDQGPNFTYEWATVGGQFAEDADLSSLDPSVIRGGDYKLTVRNTENGCVSSDTVLIDTNFVIPKIILDADTVLTCFQPSITIDASQSDSGAIFAFNWFAEAGRPIENADSYQPAVSEAGNYILNIKNEENGCVSSDLLTIKADDERPTADAGTASTLICTNPIATLDGSNSSEGAAFIYQWSTLDGNLVGDTTNVVTTADSAGTYTLTVTDTTNGCFVEDNVEIFKNFDNPQLTIPTDSILTCQEPSIGLSATSTTENTIFTWELPDGSTEAQAEITTVLAGLYLATATATNGCTTVDSLRLDSEQLLPNIVVDDPATITCSEKTTILMGENSDQGVNFEIEWSTEDGHFIDEAQSNQYNPVVDSGGIYQVKLTNTETGCVATSSIFVPQSTNSPSIVINEPDTFTCTNKVIPLSASTDANNPAFQWKIGPTILTEAAAFEATEPATYTIIVMNQDNNCSSLASISTPTDTIKPLAEAGQSLELNCAEGEVELDGSQSVQGEQYRYLWTDQNNQNLSENLQVTVQNVGLYNLIVADISNGCRSVDTVRVNESRENPIADAGKDTTFCTGSEDRLFTLGGNLTSVGADFAYTWCDLDGNALGDSIIQQVTAIDTFVLKVINNANNCTSSDTVIVFEKPRPLLSLTQTGGINCRDNEITYSVTSDLPNTAFKWVGEFEIEGPILTVTDELLGENFVAVGEDTTSGCLGNSSIVAVAADRFAPIIFAGENTEVNCTDTLRLQGEILSQNLTTSVEWSTDGGNFTAENTVLNPLINEAGNYVLTVENTNNFCVSKDTVLVEENKVIPTLSLKETAFLTCNEQTFTIRPDSLSTGTDFYYFWKRAGDVISQADSLTVDLPNRYELMVIDSSNLCTNTANIVVADSTKPPVIAIDPPDQIDCVNNQVVINTNINITDGSYQWSILEGGGNILGSRNSPDLLVDQAGTYEIAVTNNFTGCEGKRNVKVVDIRDTLSIEAGPDRTITCFNDSTVLAAGTIFSEGEHLVFEWTSSAADFQAVDSTLILNISETGTYFLTVRDTVSTCFAVDSFSVGKAIDNLDFSIGQPPTIDCDKEEVIVGDINDIGVEGYTYQWSTQDGTIKSGQTQPAALVTAAGLYQINIENSQTGCSLTDTIRVSENRAFPTVDVGERGQVLTCVEETLTIGGAGTSIGNEFSYQWSTIDEVIEGATESTLAVSRPATYELLVTNTENNCVTADTISILADKDLPTVSFPAELAFSCSDASVAIEPTPSVNRVDLAVNWQTKDGTIISPTDILEVEVGNPGWYVLTFENTQNSCASTDSVLIADDRILPQVVDLDNQMLGCNDQAITVSAQGSDFGNTIAYEWQNEEGDPLSNNTTLTLNQTGTFVLKVENRENDCVATDTFLVMENTNPPTSAIFTVESPTCEGEDDGFIEVIEVIGGTAPYQYQLDTMAQIFTEIFSDLSPKAYTLTITDDVACEWDTIIVLNQPDSITAAIAPAFDQLVTGETGTFILETSLLPSEISDITWTPADLFDCTSCLEVDATFARSTLIGVTVEDINGCESSADFLVEVDLANVPNAITPNGDGVNDLFMVPQIEAAPDAFPDSELVVFNRWGDVLYQASPYNNDWAGTNNNGDLLLEGTYYYVLRLDTREGETIKGDITILRR
ncbi:MAG: gliding motility-associated C-terminal domain-containing protein [Bacteroidota bacterium]